MTKTPCGGMYIDDDTLYFEGNILKAKKQEFEIPDQIAYHSGDGIIIDGSTISINQEIAKKQDIVEALNKYEPDLSGIDTTLQEFGEFLANTESQVTVNTENIENHTNKLSSLEGKDTNLQEQIDDLKQYNQTYNPPIATAGRAGLVMPRQGLHVEEDGTLDTTIQLYGDMGSGVVFLDHGETKNIKLYTPCHSLYIEFYLVDTVNVAGSNLLFIASYTEGVVTKGNLTASFDEVSFTVTNNHATNAMFLKYGCADII